MTQNNKKLKATTFLTKVLLLDFETEQANLKHFAPVNLLEKKNKKVTHLKSFEVIKISEKVYANSTREFEHFIFSFIENNSYVNKAIFVHVNN